jgi:hypothetical protein
VLDLYARRFEGRRLRPDEYVISADEKTQAASTRPPSRDDPARAGTTGAGRVRVPARRDARLSGRLGRAPRHLFDRVEQTTGIVPFGRLVDQVMQIEPYRSARTVYWVVDNGSSHAGKASVKRMAETYPNAKLIHLPVHAS